MPEQKIFVIGNDETVTMLELIGIDGLILSENDDFLKEFNKITNDPSISLIIIAIDLPEKIVDYLIDFKLNRRIPFIFYIPDIFNIEPKAMDLLINRIYRSIGKILIS